jgi:DNA-binding CsgD family transcriptional regulator
LSARKREAFFLWAMGVPERQIAKQLCKSKGWVWFTLQDIKKILGTAC